LTAEELIDTLEQRAMLPAETIGSLRQFVAKSLKIVTPESLAALLVERGRLTAPEAKQLLDHSAAKPAAAAADEFSLVPIDDLASRKQAKTDARNVADAAAHSAPAKATSTTAGPSAKPMAAAMNAKSAAATKPAKPTTQSAKTPHAADLGTSTTGAGSLDDLFGSDPDDALAGIERSPLGASPRQRTGIPKWIWIAAAGGTALVVFVVALLMVLNRSNGDAEWQLAEKDFAAGSDQDAIAKLDAFLLRFPDHPRSKTANLYHGMARLRQAAATKTDGDRTLAIAREVLPKVVDQPDFAKSREGLSKLLPEMAAALAKRTKNSDKVPIELRRRQVEAAVEALALAKNPRYTPDSQKPWAALQTAEIEVAIAARSVDRQTELERATGEIRSAIAADKMTAGFSRRDRLLGAYPELRQDDALETLDQELAEAEAKSLKFNSARQRAETKPRPSSIVSTAVVAVRNDKLSADAASDGPAAAIFFQGTAFWIDSANGSPLAREFLGFDSIAPEPIESSGKDFIVYDELHQELVRETVRSASVVWRQALGGALAGRPLIRGPKLYCATRAGRLMMLDIDTGDIVRSAQFAEALRAPPAISADGENLYVATDRGNLFVLAVKDIRPSSVTRLGSDPGLVALAPIGIGKYLIVVQDQDFDDSVLRVLAVGRSSDGIRIVQELPLSGHVCAPTIIDGQRLFMATDRGAIVIFAPSGPAGAPLVKAAELSADDKAERQPRYLAAQGRRIWIGGKGIAGYDAAATGQLRPVWQRFMDERVIAPPILLGGPLIVATERAGQSGFFMKALNSDNGEPKWDKHLVVAATDGSLHFIAGR
jgi:hypothetical protein